jgi:hypothetical protein
MKRLYEGCKSRLHEDKGYLKLESVAAVTFWGLQRCRCKFIFKGIQEPTGVVIKVIWNDLVHSLKEESGVPFKEFQNDIGRNKVYSEALGTTSIFMDVCRGGLVWNYKSLNFLFPPPGQLHDS